ncbi:hypothetical protein P3T73_13585 [Kiritimatiellota bacterium B12222]|nr:hypothetical protein P3T73_13585 [Kiritimatiellota bacterium B12222]
MRSQRFCISRLLLFVGLFYFCLHSCLHAAEELGIRQVDVPLVDGEVDTRNILQVLLEAGNSDVVLPEDFPSQKITIDSTSARIQLATWNLMLKGFGVTVSPEEETLKLQVDLKVFEATLDEFEAKLVSLFKVEREAVMIRFSEESCTGPVVVLVHGLDSSKRLFSGICAYLVAGGYDVYFFEYPNDDRVERNAARLAEALKSIPADREHGISLVTVSMGGVISQLLLESPDYEVKGVTRFIACVPPFQGSEMAALRGVIEIGDHTLSVIFDPQKSLDFWGDGMGRAGIDLQPGSLLMETLDQLERNPEITYSILAGNEGMFDPKLLTAARDELAEESSENALAETARLLTLDRMNLLLAFQSPHGDGVVQLESATLEGVEDRVVLPFSHLDFLTGFFAKDDIPALQEVLERLPPVKK